MEIESERAKQRQQATLPKEGTDGKFQPLSSNELDGEKGQARDKAARKVGLSPTTFQRGLVPLFSMIQELLDALQHLKTPENFLHRLEKNQFKA